MKKPFRLGSRVCAHAPLRVRTKAEGLRFCLRAHSDEQSIRQKKDPDKGRSRGQSSGSLNAAGRQTFSREEVHVKE